MVEEVRNSHKTDHLRRLKYEFAQEIGINKKSKTHEKERDIKK